MFTHPNRIVRSGFYRGADLDFAARAMLGRAATGLAEVGEVLATLARIDKASQWAGQWASTAGKAQRRAETSRAGGHLVSAEAGFRHAASYWAAAVDGLTTSADNERLLTAFRAHRNCWDAAVDCAQGAHLRVEIPYENTMLPGYLLRPDASGARRPTLVMTNGSDGAISDMWGSGAAGALARGWNAFVYDGPGQQSMLFEHRTFFRPDWEAVLTPVVDALVGRDDVDASALLGYGISQGGYWLPRALAFEHRLVAAVADPGVVDVSASWEAALNDRMRSMLDSGDRKGFNKYLGYAARIPSIRATLTFRSRPYGDHDWFGLYEQVRRQRIDAELAAGITTPLLITSPEGEQFWPGQSRRLADLLPGRAEVVEFSAADGADLHCQPMGRTLTDVAMFDWFDRQLARTGN